MKSKPGAAANLCNWVVNIVMFNKVYKKVKPLMEELELAQAAKAAAEADLAVVQEQLDKLAAELEVLQKDFLVATQEKAVVEAEANDCLGRLELAERLTNGLSSENERWGREIDQLRIVEGTMVGDVLLSAAFVSYVGAFGAKFRQRLWRDRWIPDLISREIRGPRASTRSRSSRTTRSSPSG